jgi:rsbT antagonist protein RsbS
MSGLDDISIPIPIQLTRSCLVASIQVDLNSDTLRRFQQDLLERIASTHAKGVILDVSGVEIMDADDFDALRRACAMARLMGARAIMVGLRPGIVAALVDLDVAVDGMEATLDLESAFDSMSPAHQPPADESVVPAPEPDVSTDDSKDNAARS